MKNLITRRTMIAASAAGAATLLMPNVSLAKGKQHIVEKLTADLAARKIPKLLEKVHSLTPQAALIFDCFLRVRGRPG
jgi:PDZ domain-containing secreted protein